MSAVYIIVSIMLQFIELRFFHFLKSIIACDPTVIYFKGEGK